VARPKAVVTSEVMHETLAGADELAWRRLPPKRLKGIGLSRLWSLRRAGT
jgi:class 3 adenylate cyclase